MQVTNLIILQIVYLFYKVQVPLKEPIDVCISVNSAYYGKDWKRLFTNALEHSDGWHLSFNMMSFMWKGVTLERNMGSIRYCVMLLLLIFLTSCCYLGLNLFLYDLTRDDWFVKSCSVGFSGKQLEHQHFMYNFMSCPRCNICTESYSFSQIAKL